MEVLVLKCPSSISIAVALSPGKQVARPPSSFPKAEGLSVLLRCVSPASLLQSHGGQAGDPFPAHPLSSVAAPMSPLGISPPTYHCNTQPSGHIIPYPGPRWTLVPEDLTLEQVRWAGRVEQCLERHAWTLSRPLSSLRY